MDLPLNPIEIILHVDDYLVIIFNAFGALTYLILFLIVFAETGFVVTPFLPGDSLLFAAGALAAGDFINPVIVWLVLVLAAVGGDTVNYWIGNFIGERAYSSRSGRFLKKEYLKKTQDFYDKYGGKAIIIARFIPVVRTFAPFVAGVGKMDYRKFLSYNIAGGLLWVTLFVWAGFFFGNLPLVKHNFSLVIMTIILISILPAIIEFAKHKRRSR